MSMPYLVKLLLTKRRWLNLKNSGQHIISCFNITESLWSQSASIIWVYRHHNNSRWLGPLIECFNQLYKPFIFIFANLDQISEVILVVAMSKKGYQVTIRIVACFQDLQVFSFMCTIHVVDTKEQLVELWLIFVLENQCANQLEIISHIFSQLANLVNNNLAVKP